jgi:hypothetical protein
VHDVIVVETTNYVSDRVDAPDVTKELVAEPFTLRCATNKACDVDEGHLSWNELG